MSKTHTSFVNEIFCVKHLLGTVEWKCYHKGVTQLHVEDFLLILTSSSQISRDTQFFSFRYLSSCQTSLFLSMLVSFEFPVWFIKAYKISVIKCLMNLKKKKQSLPKNFCRRFGHCYLIPSLSVRTPLRHCSNKETFGGFSHLPQFMLALWGPVTMTKSDLFLHPHQWRHQKKLLR